MEAKYNYSLPDDLKNCIKENNGGVPSPCCYDFGSNKNKVFGGLLSFNKSDHNTIYDFIELFRTKNKAGLIMFPFGIDPAGNFLCVKNKKIVFYDHETDMVFPICNTFTELLERLHD